MSQKRLRFKLSPELCDGSRWCVVDNKSAVLELVGMWCDGLEGFGPGDFFTVEFVAMSDEEVEALPDL